MEKRRSIIICKPKYRTKQRGVLEYYLPSDIKESTTMSSLDDTLVCVVCGGGSDGGDKEVSSSTKKCTSCDKKNDHCNTTSNVGSVDAISDTFGREANISSICAACGKAGDHLKACTACHLVKYCNRDCQISHRSKHKKECRKRAAELQRAKDDYTSDKLFQDPPPKEDCPICFLPIPFAMGPSIGGMRTSYMACCGKTLCCGCVVASKNEIKKGKMKDCCVYCRVPLPKSEEEVVKRLRRRMELNDPDAFYGLGCEYRDGDLGLPQDMNKALELWNKAAELGSISAHHALGVAYDNWDRVEVDNKKVIHHWKIAAIGGHEMARYQLGGIEYNDGNMSLAMKHFKIGARSGEGNSLKMVGEGFKTGHVTKEDYASTLRAYQMSVDEMKSEQRTRAAEELSGQTIYN